MIKTTAFKVLLPLTALAISILIGVSAYPPEPELAAVEDPKKDEYPVYDYPHAVTQKENLWTALTRMGLPGPEIHGLVQAAKPYFNLNRVLPSMPFRVEFSEGKASLVEFKLETTRLLNLVREGEGWVAREIVFPMETDIVHFQGMVFESLWDSALRAELNPALIVELTEIFAWQIDFARELREGDRWRISVRRNTVRGEFAGWGPIIAAEYINDGNVFQAVRYERNGELVGYFDRNGDSLEKMFLKSPMKYGRISSGFSKRRFHPVQKVYRPHNGVDYAAPTGTPIRTVGDGRIVAIETRGGAGKMIRIQHNEIYRTTYMHMSRFAKGLRQGSRVKQGQVIGYVGSTGLATGPHLHYEFHQRGRFVDPLRVQFPSAKPVPKEWMADFKVQAGQLTSTLPVWQMAQAGTPDESEIQSE